MSPALAGGFFTTSTTWETGVESTKVKTTTLFILVRKKSINLLLVLHRQTADSLNFQLTAKVLEMKTPLQNIYKKSETREYLKVTSKSF